MPGQRCARGKDGGKIGRNGMARKGRSNGNEENNNNVEIDSRECVIKLGFGDLNEGIISKNQKIKYLSQKICQIGKNMEFSVFSRKIGKIFQTKIDKQEDSVGQVDGNIFVWNASKKIYANVDCKEDLIDIYKSLGDKQVDSYHLLYYLSCSVEDSDLEGSTSDSDGNDGNNEMEKEKEKEKDKDKEKEKEKEKERERESESDSGSENERENNRNDECDSFSLSNRKKRSFNEHCSHDSQSDNCGNEESPSKRLKYHLSDLIPPWLKKAIILSGNRERPFKCTICGGLNAYIEKAISHAKGELKSLEENGLTSLYKGNYDAKCKDCSMPMKSNHPQIESHRRIHLDQQRLRQLSDSMQTQLRDSRLAHSSQYYNIAVSGLGPQANNNN